MDAELDIVPPPDVARCVSASSRETRLPASPRPHGIIGTPRRAGVRRQQYSPALLFPHWPTRRHGWQSCCSGWQPRPADTERGSLICTDAPASRTVVVVVDLSSRLAVVWAEDALRVSARNRRHGRVVVASVGGHVRQIGQGCQHVVTRPGVRQRGQGAAVEPVLAALPGTNASREAKAQRLRKVTTSSAAARSRPSAQRAAGQRTPRPRSCKQVTGRCEIGKPRSAGEAITEAMDAYVAATALHSTGMHAGLACLICGS